MRRRRPVRAPSEPTTKDTGEHLGSIDLRVVPGGNAVTYLHEGKQYLMVAVGSGSSNAELLALTLPSREDSAGRGEEWGRHARAETHVHRESVR